MSASGVRRGKAALFQWAQVLPEEPESAVGLLEHLVDLEHLLFETADDSDGEITIADIDQFLRGRRHTNWRPSLDNAEWRLGLFHLWFGRTVDPGLKPALSSSASPLWRREFHEDD